MKKLFVATLIGVFAATVVAAAAKQLTVRTGVQRQVANPKLAPTDPIRMKKYPTDPIRMKTFPGDPVRMKR